jgi:hypothetical protein
MNHNDAVRLQAAEKYVLNELTDAERDAYEEHYFDCPACADELKTTVAFMENARQVFREGAFEPQAVPARAAVSAPSTGGFFAWLKPAFAIPVFAALLLVIGYQNAVMIPRLERVSAPSAAAQVVRYFSLQPAGARAAESAAQTFQVGANEDFSIDVDMPGDSADGYLCQIQDEAGRVRVTLPVSAEEAKNTVRVNIPGGSLQAGKYNFVIFKGQAQDASRSTANAAAQIPFVIEFRP